MQPNDAAQQVPAGRRAASPRGTPRSKSPRDAAQQDYQAYRLEGRFALLRAANSQLPETLLAEVGQSLRLAAGSGKRGRASTAGYTHAVRATLAAGFERVSDMARAAAHGHCPLSTRWSVSVC